MRAAYLVHQQHEDKSEDKGYTDVGVQPGMVMAILMYNRDFRYLLRLNHMLHLARWVMLPCGRRVNGLRDRGLNMAQSHFSSFAKSIPHAFLDITQKSSFKVSLRPFTLGSTYLSGWPLPIHLQHRKAKEALALDKPGYFVFKMQCLNKLIDKYC